MSDKWYVVGDGWTDAIRSKCQDRCGDFGDSACYKLGETGMIGGVVKVITPCTECLGE